VHAAVDDAQVLRHGDDGALAAGTAVSVLVAPVGSANNDVADGDGRHAIVHVRYNGCTQHNNNKKGQQQEPLQQQQRTRVNRTSATGSRAGRDDTLRLHNREQ
jgi:hypothetical protein